VGNKAKILADILWLRVYTEHISVFGQHGSPSLLWLKKPPIPLQQVSERAKMNFQMAFVRNHKPDCLT
jgi:hypothetical protein